MLRPSFRPTQVLLTLTMLRLGLIKIIEITITILVIREITAVGGGGLGWGEVGGQRALGSFLGGGGVTGLYIVI